MSLFGYGLSATGLLLSGLAPLWAANKLLEVGYRGLRDETLLTIATIAGALLVLGLGLATIGSVLVAVSGGVGR